MAIRASPINARTLSEGEVAPVRPRPATSAAANALANVAMFTEGTRATSIFCVVSRPLNPSTRPLASTRTSWAYGPAGVGGGNRIQMRAESAPKNFTQLGRPGRVSIGPTATNATESAFVERRYANIASYIAIDGLNPPPTAGKRRPE